MIAVGVDTHKHEHLARALDGLGQLVGGMTIKADPAGYLELADWLTDVGEDPRRGGRAATPGGAPPWEV